MERDFAASDLTPVLGTLDEIARWQAHARSVSRPLPAILHVDTGMNRLGLDARELAMLADDHTRLHGIDLRYVMTHLVSAECPDDPVNEQQRARFDAACARLPPPRRSLANSSGPVPRPGFRVRPRPARGRRCTASIPQPGRPNPQRPVVQLRARILQVREIAAGETRGL